MKAVNRADIPGTGYIGAESSTSIFAFANDSPESPGGTAWNATTGSW